MYTTGQEVTAKDKIGTCTILKSWMNDAGNERAYKLLTYSGGEILRLESEISAMEPRKAVIWQSTYPRLYMVSNRRV